MAEATKENMEDVKMRHLKRFTALLLTLVLVLSLTTPISVAMDHTGFSDVDGDAWYAEAVMYCRV